MNKISTLFCLFTILLSAACQSGPAPQPTQGTAEVTQPPTQAPPSPTPAPTETTQPATATTAPTDTSAPTETTAPTVAPPPVNVAGVLSPEDFSIGTVAGVADSWFVTVEDGTPYEPFGPPPMRGWPPHLFVTFEQDGSPEADPNYFAINAPQGRVFPVQAYLEMFEQANNPLIGQWIDELKRILEERPQTFGSPFDEPIPVLPDVGATQDLHEKISYIDFTGGSGIGFVGHYAQDVGPFTNEHLAYFFQGLTSDGAHYLSFVQPLAANFLPENFQEVPQETLDAISADPQAYLQEVTQTIANADNSDFTPDLDALTSMYRSIVIGGPASGTPAAGTPSSGTPAAGTPAATPGAVGSTGTPTSAAPGLTGFLWTWEELREAGSDDIQVTDPLSYTLSLMSDGSLSIRADCNQGSGRYTLGESGSISFTLGAMTKVACPEGSLSEEYLDLLANTAAYELNGGTLALELKDDGGQMIFTVGQREIAVTVTPEAGAATVTTTESLNILSGPGGQFPSYGQVPAGTVLEVVGKSPDGAWWVVKLPPSILANGQGWVSGRYVETENVEDVPVIQPPPAP